MTEIIFKDLCVQKGDRVKIPKAIVDTLGLTAGEKVVVMFDVDKRQIRIIEEKKRKK